MQDTVSAFTLSFTPRDENLDTNALIVEGLSISAPKAPLFVNASLRIAAGHRYGLLGPNGQGKTTLLNHIACRALPVPSGWDVLLVEQEAKVSDKSVVEEVLSADVEGIRLAKEEERLLEEFENSADKSSEELEEVQGRLEAVMIELESRGAEQAEAKVRKILNGLGFIGAAQDRPIKEFSGGWRMRVNLAKALFIQPKLLMLDEPTNHLDLDAVLWLDKYLSADYPYTVLVVSHDADFLDSVCTDIICVQDRKLLQYKGGYTDFTKMRDQQKAKAEKDWDIYQKAKRNAKTKQAKEALEKQNANLSKPSEYKVKFQLKGLDKTRGAQIGGIGLSEVSFSYFGHEPWLLKDLEFGIDCSSRIALVGPNGTGKSTFLKLLTGELQPCKGKAMTNPGLRVEMFSQHFEEGLDLTVTPVEFLLKVSSDFKVDSMKSPENARQCLSRYGLSSEAHVKLIGNLSGGQKARVAFAALGLRAPHILILDEPTNHLDIETVEALIDALEKYSGGVLLVSHDARLISNVGCTLYFCKDHRIAKFNGEFEEYKEMVLKDIEVREAEMLEISKMSNKDERKERFRKALEQRKSKSVLNFGKKREIDSSSSAPRINSQPSDEIADMIDFKQKTIRKKSVKK